MTLLLTAFQFVSIMFATAAVYTGAQALVDPIGFSKSFGLQVDESKPNEKAGKSRTATADSRSYQDFTKSYISLMGVRQLATGIILLTFAYQRKWIEMATILAIIGFVVAGTDGFYLARSGKRNAGIFHAIPGALIALLAYAVVYTDARS